MRRMSGRHSLVLVVLYSLIVAVLSINPRARTRGLRKYGPIMPVQDELTDLNAGKVSRRNLLVDWESVNEIPKFVGSLQGKVSGDWKHLCTCGLVARGWVLTSLDCMYLYDNIPILRAVFNRENIDSSSSFAKTISINKSGRKTKPVANLVLLPLTSEISATQFEPLLVSAQPNGYYEQVGQALTVTTWIDANSDGPASLSEFSSMKSLDLEIRNSEMCTTYFNASNGTESSEQSFCASAYESLDNTTETCYGDLGAPLYTYDSDGNAILVGVVQQRNGCVATSYIADATRPSLYLDWIEEKVGESVAAPEPSMAPTVAPTLFPTNLPTPEPTFAPTMTPTMVPTRFPTPEPTNMPTPEPTQFPTMTPTTAAPTMTPTLFPTNLPTVAPTMKPTNNWTDAPTAAPSAVYPIYVTPSPTPDTDDAANPSTTTGSTNSGGFDLSSSAPIIGAVGGVIGVGIAFSVVFAAYRRRHRRRSLQRGSRSDVQLSPFDHDDNDSDFGAGGSFKKRDMYEDHHSDASTETLRSGWGGEGPALNGRSLTRENPVFIDPQTSEHMQQTRVVIGDTPPPPPPPPPGFAARIRSHRFIPKRISAII